jgi:hypothetical protein
MVFLAVLGLIGLGAALRLPRTTAPVPAAVTATSS